MSVKESLGTTIMGKRTLIVILAIAILWRTGVSLDGQIALWESMCSGIALFIMGWAVFAYIYWMSRELTGWLRLSKIYLWIAVSIAAINTYVLVYYGMRWYRLAGVRGVVETAVPLDFLFRDIRYIVLVLFYCVIIWLTKYLREMHRDYLLTLQGEQTG
ncbi:MAG: hypothetical protein BA871_07540 [Desulfuromonadales bacterium C00003096]|nr:MAG: hypothetical protein BA871_07540 [Desulfuromonadales bacterium C00003096]